MRQFDSCAPLSYIFKIPASGAFCKTHAGMLACSLSLPLTFSLSHLSHLRLGPSGRLARSCGSLTVHGFSCAKSSMLSLIHE